MNHLTANRNSTPEASSSSLRPPQASRGIGAGHQFRASADMGGHTHSNSSVGVRPASEVYYSQHSRHQNQGGQDDNTDKYQEWINNIDQFQSTLEEMAAATLDQDFKDELSAIEQWFHVLSEAERTAALYALLQQTTQVQTRFFIEILQEMAKSHPVSGMLSPSSFHERDPMSNRLSTAMTNRLSVEGSRASANLGRPPASPSVQRNSLLNEQDINNMFPEAVAAINKQRADFTEKTGTEPRSNRSSAIVGNRSSLAAPTISAPPEERGRDTRPQQSSWRGDPTASAQSSGPQAMGHFSQAPPSAGLRPGGRPAPISADANVQNQSIDAPQPSSGIANMNSLLSPYHGSGNWASMVNTPANPNFPAQDSSNNASMVANATAMKLAAIPTLNGRVQLDDARKYRRSRSQEGHGPISPGLMPTGMNNLGAMTNEYGQILSPNAAASFQAQQIAAQQQQQQARRSRPNSPGLTVPGQGHSGMNLAGQTNNGMLSAYDPNQQNLLNSMNNLSLGGFGNNGQLHDPSEINRGRSPRGKRGTSRPPEDPTDMTLLKDIPAWLRSLRLHKYTDNLKDVRWEDLIEMDDAGLEKRGVHAVGARRKMLKVFEEVKTAKAEGKLHQ